MKKLSLLLAAALIFAMFTSCSTNETNKPDVNTPETNKPDVDTPETGEPTDIIGNFNIEDFLKIDGSTVTKPLLVAIAKKLTNCTESDIEQNVKHNMTSYAYANLIEKTTDVIFVTGPSEEELNNAKASGVEFEIIPIVNDAFVFIVNKENPVNNLSAAQIIDIYSGKITNWKEVGGSDLEIIPYQREKNSGSQTGMVEHVMKDVPLMDAPELFVHSMEGLVKQIADYDNSIQALGYTYYYFANLMYVKESVKFIGVDGVIPNNENIMNNSYPFVTPYYAVIRKDEPENSFARNLIKYILSGEGQEIAAESGYVKLKS